MSDCPDMHRTDQRPLDSPWCMEVISSEIGIEGMHRSREPLRLVHHRGNSGRRESSYQTEFRIDLDGILARDNPQNRSIFPLICNDMEQEVGLPVHRYKCLKRGVSKAG